MPRSDIYAEFDLDGRFQSLCDQAGRPVASIGGAVIGWGKSRRTNYGARAFQWNGLAAYENLNGGAVQADTRFGDSHVALLPYNAGRARVSGTLAAPINMTGYKALGLWIESNAQGGRALRVYITGDGYATAYQWDLYVHPGARYYVLPFDGAALLGAPARNAINGFRLIDTPNTLEVGNPLGGLQAGESLMVGAFRLAPRARAAVLINTDDGYESNVRNDALNRSAYPASGATYLEIASYYGLKGTAYIIPELVDTGAPWATKADLAALRDAGWVLGSHSNVGTGSGLANLADEQAVYEEVSREMDRMEALGFGEHVGHFSLPQGGYSHFVWSALDRVSRLKTVRGIGSVNGANYSPQSIPAGETQTSNSALIWRSPKGAAAIRGGQQLDGALTNADTDNYLNNLVAAGAVGTCYTHSITPAIASNFDYFCSKAAQLRAAGLLDVLTVDEWYRSLGA